MYKIIKRFFDILLSLLVILLLSPLLFPIMVGLLLTGEGEIWYKQKRIGFKNKPFLIWKFATMLKNSPKMAGGIITTKKDPRITPMGGFLRKSKINELPQLINIFKGDMSFVGPRPLMSISFETYTKDVQKVIYNVKPGLTGIGSIVF
ncbi:sugar transferase, partial [Flavobacteriaceae bacterium]|nr:sugar transferase [Flavobacteriaceae bacterium]